LTIKPSFFRSAIITFTNRIPYFVLRIAYSVFS
jgi:hypothetical protein